MFSIEVLAVMALALAASSLWLNGYRGSDAFIRKCAKTPPDPALLDKIKRLHQRASMLPLETGPI